METLTRATRYLLEDRMLTALLTGYIIVTTLTHGKTLLEPWNYVKPDTLAILASLLLVARGIELSGYVSRVSSGLVAVSRGSSRISLVALLSATALSSAIMMNDSALFIYIPIALGVASVCSIDEVWAVTLVTIAANIGSSITPIGNPQNVIIWNYYKIRFGEFIASMAPFTFTAYLVLLAYGLLVVRNGKCKKSIIPAVKARPKLFWTSILLLAVNVSAYEAGMVFVGILVTLSVLAMVDRRVITGLDHALLASFILIFLDFNGLAEVISESGFLASLRDPTSVFLAGVLASQLVSNVPATVFLLGYTDSWKALAVGVNVGGVGILWGSIANLIAVRLSGVSAWEVQKRLAPYFVMVLAVVVMLF